MPKSPSARRLARELLERFSADFIGRYAGVNPRQIYLYRQGKRNPGAKTRRALEELLTLARRERLWRSKYSTRERRRRNEERLARPKLEPGGGGTTIITRSLLPPVDIRTGDEGNIPADTVEDLVDLGLRAVSGTKLAKGNWFGDIRVRFAVRGPEGGWEDTWWSSMAGVELRRGIPTDIATLFDRISAGMRLSYSPVEGGTLYATQIRLVMLPRGGRGNA